MSHQLRLLSCAFALLSISAYAQLNTKIAPSQVRALAQNCATRVHPDTIEAIIRQESAYYPYSLSINYPKTEAARFGHTNALYQLARQPHTEREALAWTRWLLDNGHTVSIGLMQVNSQEAGRLGITDLVSLFDPCINIAAGALLLQESFQGQSPTLSGLSHAFSVYNSGSSILGIENGYAAGVISNSPPLRTIDPQSTSTIHHHQQTNLAK
jgi:type IV secretion system protein VirB1